MVDVRLLSSGDVTRYAPDHIVWPHSMVDHRGRETGY